MTYAMITTHLFPLFHYTIAFWFLFILLPKWLFSTSYVDRSERWFAAYVKMILFLILSGYLLVITKLYEVLSILALIMVIIGYRFVQREQAKKTGTLKNHLLRRLFNWLDGLNKFTLSDINVKIVNKVSGWTFTVKKKFSWIILLEGIALIIVLSGAAYVRFYDAFVHAAPPLSDSYVTLAWMKYIDSRELFHDGIYPQGFHIYLATLFKFAAVDALFILRYTGPLNAILFTFGLYIVIRKLTNTGVGAIVAAFIFGVCWVIMPFTPIEFERQAATNSQEFAFVFILPAIFFLVKFIGNKRKEDLIVGLVCTTIIGLVHSLAYMLIGMLIGILIISSLLTIRNSFKSVISVCIGALLTVIVSLVPLGAGYLLGQRFHSSSAEYLVDRKEATYTYPDVTFDHYIALGACIILLFCLFSKKNTSIDRFILVFTVLAGCSVFTLYFAGGTWTQSTLIASRSSELWGLLLPFCVGVSISYLFRWVRGKWNSMLYIPLIFLVIMTWIVYKPMPIVPYKLEHDENIEQYLRIRHEYLPKTWMIVSQIEGFSVSLGTGFHMHLGDFLQKYQPEGEALTSIEDGKVDTNLSQNIFIFMEKDVFEVSESNSVYALLKPEYERRAREYTQLSEWMNIHHRAGYEVTTYFENENIRVYHLQTSEDDSLLLKNIWGH
ncbi:hypothetical protein [Psychrobacillus lasiicapitis]|uniref:Glycosyltransferase RgtA/B/C/D-like domain-containing protein n=1 Tax=Psychrobacillus lasiicapitis TaxID=1636719 RepID=A0A544T365_9BACI|nr:hypothetical protein [Psychrobacillus lasiicapitis]TQR11854.1 hypothetical protein FG382_14680 [Psychrobacillus lasiicapitis]GGA19985.1 hypothetical protein GCM10011384_06670 [Psychrobacillus lasiicapitis]